MRAARAGSAAWEISRQIGICEIEQASPSGPDSVGLTS
jgi:hypothetical protein